MIDVAVVGAAGYTGAELIRLVAGHPGLSLALVTSAAEAGTRVSDVYPSLATVDLAYVEPDAERIAEAAQLAFLAVPHTASMALAPRLLDAGLTVIDLSADFRLADPLTYERWYGVPHAAAEWLSRAVYGLPELARADIAGKQLVACPGCYPTASLLAAVPAIEAGAAASERVIVDAKSGVSGAGRSPSPAAHFVTANEAVSAYKVASHRHTPEIAQQLAIAAGAPVGLTFTPHLVPMTRGLLATVYLEMTEPLTTSDLVELYTERYSGEPFVTVHPAGRMPSTAEVRGSNRAHIGVAADEDAGTIVAVCAIDNLGKGAAGQAVQCANLTQGLAETAGLDFPAAVV
ncbi:MAG TPA: N-acetyl-gamma-glutamyl-phosphate reductase [Coriobacteriia bacterium]|jgi:N-acetyl-gamma-glutamyl-phosphate reductase